MGDRKPKPKLRLGDIKGPGGNAFVILGEAQHAARLAGWSENTIETILDGAIQGDYEHLLETIERHFDVSYE